MPPPNFNAERAAAVLVDAAYLGDGPAAAKWKVATRTLRNYRVRLRTDAGFAELFRVKRHAAEGHWASELNRGLTAVIRKVAMVADSIVVPDDGILTVELVQGLTVLNESARTLGEIAIAREVLNAADGQPGAPAAPAGASLAAGGRHTA